MLTAMLGHKSLRLTIATHNAEGKSENGDVKRKRKSRWGDEEKKVNIPGLPTALPANMSKDQMDQYLCKLLHRFDFFPVLLGVSLIF